MFRGFRDDLRLFSAWVEAHPVAFLQIWAALAFVYELLAWSLFSGRLGDNADTLSVVTLGWVGAYALLMALFEVYSTESTQRKTWRLPLAYLIFTVLVSAMNLCVAVPLISTYALFMLFGILYETDLRKGNWRLFVFSVLVLPPLLWRRPDLYAVTAGYAVVIALFAACMKQPIRGWIWRWSLVPAALFSLLLALILHEELPPLVAGIVTISGVPINAGSAFWSVPLFLLILLAYCKGAPGREAPGGAAAPEVLPLRILVALWAILTFAFLLMAGSLLGRVMAVPLALILLSYWVWLSLAAPGPKGKPKNKKRKRPRPHKRPALIVGAILLLMVWMLFAVVFLAFAWQLLFVYVLLMVVVLLLGIWVPLKSQDAKPSFRAIKQGLPLLFVSVIGVFIYGTLFIHALVLCLADLSNPDAVHPDAASVLGNQISLVLAAFLPVVMFTLLPALPRLSKRDGIES